MKGNSETLVDVLEERCRDQAEQRAYVFLENGERESQVLTYRDLALQARRIAAELQLLSAAGERVLLVYPQGLDFIAAFFGCLHAGGVAVPAMSARRGHALARLRAIVMIMDPETRYPLEEGQIGEVWVSGASVAKGYWNREKETQDTFDGWLVGRSRNRFLRTGDLGFLLEGELFITGRMRDLLIIRGQNHYPHDIERTVEKSHPAIRPACAAAFTVEGESNERLVVVFELRGDASCKDLKDVLGSVREAVSQEHGLLVSTAALIHSGTIPKTSSGKVQRARCREQFLTDTLEVVAMDCVPKRVIAAARDISMNYQSKCK